MSPTTQAPGTSIPAPSAPPPPTNGAVSPAVASLEALRVHEDALSSALTGMEAQQSVLRSQLRSRVPEVRVAAAPQLAQLDLQIAQTRGELAATRAQIAVRESGLPGAPGRIIIPPNFGRRSSMLDSDQITGIVIVFILAVLMPLSVGVLRRLWRVPSKEKSASVLDAISPRLDRLEHAVDAIAVEVERVSEGQRFVTKVLAERPSAAPAPASVPASVPIAGREFSNDPSLGEPKPFRALGAGPVEPIRMAERQSVRASTDALRSS